MANFDTIIPMILAAEGGATITDDPSDPGGLTKYGISQRSYPNEDIRALTEVKARIIYRRDYWGHISGDSLPDEIAYMVMDMAVNMGVQSACEELQRAINGLLRGNIINVDGKIGPQSLQALIALEPKRVKLWLLRARLERYARIVQAKPTSAKYLVGWIRRSFDVAGIV